MFTPLEIDLVGTARLDLFACLKLKLLNLAHPPLFYSLGKVFKTFVQLIENYMNCVILVYRHPVIKNNRDLYKFI